MCMKIRSLQFMMIVCSLTLLAGLGGCASSSGVGQGAAIEDGLLLDSSKIEIDDSSYEEVFEAARAVLMDYRFGINRVDAARGVITTFPKRTVGIGAFWDREQSTLRQEWEDLANQQERTIRVQFEQDPSGTGYSSRATVDVMVYRVHRPNWRVESESVGLSTHARSRDSFGNAVEADFRESMGHDRAFAERVAQQITSRFED
jgi:hypothetical protein